ncbi:hypothetical protein [Nocardioides sambongensis]|uniref:hypothetical protein n=1 Tax=Nocardioides sambongensis TaxID=2589074 RepID=UPI00112E53C7|nr:hypothetical protein [Nocardioides sambongensis]
MAKTRPLPEVGSVHLDARGGERALRASWHPAPSDGGVGVVVLSIWRGNVCTGTVRLTAEELPGLIATLAGALDAAQGSDGSTYLTSAS